MGSNGAWLALLVIGILLITEGARGHMGELLAVVFTPGLLEVLE